MTTTGNKGLLQQTAILHWITKSNKAFVTQLHLKDECSQHSLSFKLFSSLHISKKNLRRSEGSRLFCNYFRLRNPPRETKDQQRDILNKGGSFHQRKAWKHAHTCTHTHPTHPAQKMVWDCNHSNRSATSPLIPKT